MIRRLLALPIVLVALGLVLATGSGSARAVGGDLRVSLDGVRWSTSLATGLFPGTSTVAPGDRMSRTLWVKNATSSAGQFQLSRVQTAATSSLSRAISITAAIPGVTGSIPASTASACAPLLPEMRIGAGRSVAITVTLTVADLPGLEAQNEAASIGLLASLSDPDGMTASPCAGPGTTIPVTGGAASAGASNGSLAFTGTQLAYPAIMIASLLTGLGLFFFVAARRRRRSA